MTQATPVHFNYRASRGLLVAIPTIAVLAWIAILASGVPHWIHAILVIVVGVYAGISIGRLLRPRVRSIAWNGEGGLALTLNDTLTDGRRDAEGLVSTARVIGPLIVLTVRWPPREREHLWLLPDNLDADTRRRLRVRLASGNPLASGNADSP